MLGNRCFIFCFILLISCAKDEFVDSEIWGHAGSGLDKINEVPGNTLESLKKAWHIYQVDGIEFDIQLSQSGTFWLYHDENLESKTNGTGCINNLADDELQNIYYSIKLPNLNKFRMISLEEALSNAPEGSKIMLDILRKNFCEDKSIPNNDIVKELTKIKNKFPNLQLYPVSFSEDLLKKLHDEGFEHLFLELTSIDSISHIDPIFDAILIKNNAITSKDVEQLNNKAIEVMIFEVRSKSGLISALKKGPQYILSDHLKVN